MKLFIKFKSINVCSELITINIENNAKSYNRFKFEKKDI